MNQQNITVHSGDDFYLNVDLQDERGGALEVTGIACVYSIHSAAYQPAFVAKSSPADFEATGAALQIPLTATDTNSSGVYFHKLVATDRFANKVTAFTGKINFSRDDVSDFGARLIGVINTEVFRVGARDLFDFSLSTNSQYVSLL